MEQNYCININPGDCFRVVIGEFTDRSIFATEQKDDAGRIVFCNIKPQEEISLTDLWRMGARFFNEHYAAGDIRRMETFSDM